MILSRERLEYTIILSIILVLLGPCSYISHAAPCPSGTKVGASNLTSQSDVSTTDLNAFVMVDSSWRIGCCGVVESWELQVTNDDVIDVSVWEITNSVTRECRLIGKNDLDAKAAITSYAIPVAEQIPAQPGYSIGWVALMQDTIRETEDSGSGGTGCATCTYEYYLEDVGMGLPAGYSVGNKMTYSDDGALFGIAKDFAIRAVLGPGSAPAIANLPMTVMYSYAAVPVGTIVYNVIYSDSNTLDRISVSIVNSSFFSIVSGAGGLSQVNVSDELPPVDDVYQLQIEVTDGCHTKSGVLTINIDYPEPTTSTETPSTSTIPTTTAETSTTTTTFPTTTETYTTTTLPTITTTEASTTTTLPTITTTEASTTTTLPTITTTETSTTTTLPTITTTETSTTTTFPTTTSTEASSTTNLPTTTTTEASSTTTLPTTTTTETSTTTTSPTTTTTETSTTSTMSSATTTMLSTTTRETTSISIPLSTSDTETSTLTSNSPETISTSYTKTSTSFITTTEKSTVLEEWIPWAVGGAGAFLLLFMTVICAACCCYKYCCKSQTSVEETKELNNLNKNVINRSRSPKVKPEKANFLTPLTFTTAGEDKFTPPNTPRVPRAEIITPSNIDMETKTPRGELSKVPDNFRRDLMHQVYQRLNGASPDVRATILQGVEERMLNSNANERALKIDVLNYVSDRLANENFIYINAYPYIGN